MNMKIKTRFITVVLSFVLIVISAMTIAQPVEAAQTGEIDTQSSLNVRQAPSLNAKVIGSLMPGQRVEYIELGNGWGQITYQGQLGFVSTAFLSEVAGEQVEEEKRVEEKDVEKEDKFREVKPDQSESQEIKRIILDPGHGGKDPGAIGNSLQEKEVVLDIAKRVESKLREKGYDILMTRSDDTFVTLEDRVKQANNWEGDLFVSIHANGYYDSSAKGIETFYNAGSSEAREFADLVQEYVISKTSNLSRGVFKADYYVLRHTDMPAVLAETGFVSNKEDAELLKSEHYREQVAKGIVKGIEEH
ncbi:N-acetylmuramoyl-L-alanine amidase [Halobacillus shinanisalinarum]|uniref:N-acetylmuramoyl-L-alanine amidase n=1 Tax=Halobacillus shinanisalinarum TaxID=2932258 RepID=A0ABY4H4L8_9BACI|nr:N-acetylmuramoyl-L-alanine amidase [Halobacillus shinanisalinarum]UOQ95412.1 N-acetylmuramoyl-L-alanine amidase [Halobacillus shinanisalinarum]